MAKVQVDGTEYVPRPAIPKEGEKLIIGIVDNRGLMFVGYSNMKRDDDGMISMRDAQCVIKWYTGAHFNHLVNGVCEGVELGAKADIKVKEFYVTLDLPFSTIEAWKSTKVSKGSMETC